MLEIQKIIVPVDLNQHSDTLVEFALFIAKKIGAQLAVIHVMKHINDYRDFEPESRQRLENIFLTQAKTKMAAFIEGLKKSGFEGNGEILSGDASDAIIAYAKDQTADMIIISTHGAQGIEKILLGSVAERVVKGAHCPTLVFNPYKGESGYEVCKPLNSCILPV